MAIPQLSLIGSASKFLPAYRQMQIIAGFWPLKLGLEKLVADGLFRETNSFVYVLASAAPRKALSKDPSLSRFMLCLSSLSLVLLLNPIQLPLRLRILRFKGFRQALSTPSRPHYCSDEEVQSGLKIDVDGMELTSKAGRFRVASPIPCIVSRNDAHRNCKRL